MTMTAPPEITADNVATLFPEVDTSLAREVFPSATNETARSTGDLEGYDEEGPADGRGLHCIGQQ